LNERDRIGTFNVAGFLKRRFWRIAPSLLVTCFSVLIVSILLFSPSHLVDVGGQLKSSLLIHSNVYFFNQTGYFEPANEIRPLLHTWSLSAEEQFYLFFALLLLFSRVVRFEVLAGIFFFAGIVAWATMAFQIFRGEAIFEPESVLSNVWPEAERSSGAIFYLTPFRLVQFLSGISFGLFLRAKWLNSFSIRSKMLQIVVPLCAVCLIALMGTPLLASYSALPVAIAACLLMLPNPLVNSLGRTRSVQFLAKISYQVYLVHWPLIVFWKYMTFQPITLVSTLVLLGLSLVFGWGLWRLTVSLYSQPMSLAVRPEGAKFGLKLPSAILIGIVGLCLVSIGFIQSSGGMPWRVPEHRLMASPGELRALESEFCGTSHLAPEGGREFGSKLGDPIITCAANEGQYSAETNGPKAIYLFGDSHARHLVPGFATAFPKNPIRALYFTSCHAQSGIKDYVYDYEGRKGLAEACLSRNEAAMAFFETAEPAIVVIHQYAGYHSQSSPEFVEASEILVEKLKNDGHDVLWISSVVRPNKLIAECISVPITFPQFLIQKRCEGDQQTAADVLEFTKTIRSIIGSDFVDASDFFCENALAQSQGSQKCKSLNQDGFPLFRDKHHLTVQGSIEFVSHVVETSKLTDWASQSLE